MALVVPQASSAAPMPVSVPRVRPRPFFKQPEYTPVSSSRWTPRPFSDGDPTPVGAFLVLFGSHGLAMMVG